MDSARLADFTARDAVKLFAKLYVVKIVVDSVAVAALPFVKKWSYNLNNKAALAKKMSEGD